MAYLRKQVGDRLRNGAKAIDTAGDFVLASWAGLGQNGREYITFEMDVETGETFAGHYFGNLSLAMIDLEERVAARMSEREVMYA